MEDNNNNPRYLPDVITQVIVLVPSNDPRDMLGGLNSLLSSALYSAPEGLGLWWGEFCWFLESHLKFPLTESWEREVYRVVMMSDPSFDEVKIG